MYVYNHIMMRVVLLTPMYHLFSGNNLPCLYLSTDHLPEGFYRREIQIEEKRHLMFATDHQLQVLSRVSRWYMDGTLKVKRLRLLHANYYEICIHKKQCGAQYMWISVFRVCCILSFCVLTFKSHQQHYYRNEKGT